MLVDHMGKASGEFPEWAFWLGRTVWPIFVWYAAIGILRTRNVRGYQRRLLLLAMVSQPFYIWALHGEWWELNIVFNLWAATVLFGHHPEDEASPWRDTGSMMLAICVSLISDYSWPLLAVFFLMKLLAAKQQSPGKSARPGKVERALYYMFYPAHLAAIAAVWGNPLNLISNLRIHHAL